MTEPVPGTLPHIKVAMECFAARQVAERALLQWRSECVEILITALTGLPETFDATAVIDQADIVAGDIWTILSNVDLAPSRSTGTPLTPATAVHGLQRLSLHMTHRIIEFTAGAIDDRTLADLLRTPAATLRTRIEADQSSIDQRQHQGADLTARIIAVLAANNLA